MGRKEFIEDVKKLKEYFQSLNHRNASLVKGFNFQDPDLSFKFEYKRGKSFTVQISVHDSIQSYPSKFSAFVYVDGNEEDANTAAECLKNVSVDNKSVCEIVATLVPKLCDHFKIALPRDLSMSSLQKFCRLPSISLTDLRKPTPPSKSSNSKEESPGKILKSITMTPLLLLDRDMAEVRHFKYNAELLCADEMGFKVAVSLPVSRLGLSLEACDAWNLDPDRFLVCTMHFSPSYIDLQGVISNACQTKAYLLKEAGSNGGYRTIKESLKKQFPVNFAIMTSSLPKGMPSQSHHKDENLENDHFILSWTLTELLGDKFFDMLCDRIWLGIGWSGAEYADFKRKKDLDSSFLNDEESIYDGGQIDCCLARDKEPHSVLCYLESERMESSSASRNQNFLLLLLQFLRRRILLSTRYCLTCHYPHTESVSSIRPFVCGSGLCQHQALVGLGNLFEYDLINSPVVVDLLISLCHIAISMSNLNPWPSKVIGVTITTKHAVQNSLVVNWDANQGTIGVPTERGYKVAGWKIFEGEVCVNDLLEVYHPENYLPFTVNRCSPTTTVRVLEVTSNFIVTDFPIIVPKTSVPTRHVYLPFRVYRREEKNFLNYDDTPNYKVLKHTISLFPSVNTMVEYAKKKTLKSELDKLDPLLSPLLSWIISSNRTHLRLLESEDEKVQLNDTNNVTSGNWKQFVMIMSSPEKEETFQNEKEKLRIEKGGQSSGELYAFHGSPIQNWHSIIRTSLNTKKVSHGRVYGDGIYHSLQAVTSSSYTGASLHRFDTFSWKNSMLNVIKCLALCEIVNRPSEFTSTHPHLVVKDESWVTTRYLFVECRLEPQEVLNEDPSLDWSINYNQNQPFYRLQPTATPTLNRSSKNHVVYINLDPKYTPVWLNNLPLKIPKCDFSIISNELPISGSYDVGEFFYNPKEHQKLISDASSSSTNKGSIFDHNIEEDEFIDDYTEDSEMNELDDSDDQNNSDFDNEFEDSEFDFDGEDYNEVDKKRKKEEEEYSNSFDPTLLPLPEYSSKAATQRICRELKSIIQKQNSDSDDSNDLGLFVNVDLIQSVYQWVVQLKDFERNLPLAQDMVRNKVNTIDLEVRFAPDYPYVPPYIRVIRPRLLRFADGGGGHVTAGGSICMDLLTLGNQQERGWSSVYTMEAVLLQVKMALSSLEPRPARLDRQWYTEYSPAEAIESYIRVANQHNWSVPPHWAALFGR